jgi:hypothetical protein
VPGPCRLAADAPQERIGEAVTHATLMALLLVEGTEKIALRPSCAIRSAPLRHASVATADREWAGKVDHRTGRAGASFASEPSRVSKQPGRAAATWSPARPLGRPSRRRARHDARPEDHRRSCRKAPRRRGLDAYRYLPRGRSAIEGQPIAPDR